ncbi:MAG: virulence RhuM family protein [Fibrobacter sp.]|nr:virulence RhuM family protein [Fibrobacter sp.]
MPNELDHVSTTRKIRVVRKEGQRNVARRIDFYNLDMIISIGYRVNSKTGVRFRRWANQVLKDYMLKGYAINQHKIATDLQIADRLQEQRQLIEKQNAEIENVKRDVAEQDSRLSAVEKHIDFFVKSAQTPTGGILATGTRFDGFVLIADLVKSAKRSVVFIDPFATIDVLKYAAMRAKGVNAVIYSARITPEFKEAKELHNKQYPGLDLRTRSYCKNSGKYEIEIRLSSLYKKRTDTYASVRHSTQSSRAVQTPQKGATRTMRLFTFSQSSAGRPCRLPPGAPGKLPA